ncbi:MAG: tRNA (cytidine(34)-2'-O)-methyltransferase [Pseudomonadota bacterium]
MHSSEIEVALYQPEIPQNTGNIVRLCANAGAALHLIGPLGFVWDDRRLQRAGLDYHSLTHVTRHTDWDAFQQTSKHGRLIAYSTRGRRRFSDFRHEPGDVLLFGPETRGLPDGILSGCHATLTIPMVPASRSINLSNSVAIGVYEAWRQLGFDGEVTNQIR